MTEILQITPLSGYPDEIGRWLWALQAMRAKTLYLVQDLDQATLDWEGPDGQENSIGTLLYHIALVEMSWLHFDLLGQTDLPPAVGCDFPFEMGNKGGLTPVPGVPLSEHLGRLERSRTLFLEAFRGMTLADWRRLRKHPEEDEQVTPEWAVFHLVEHEAGHATQISSIRRRARGLFAGR